MVVKTVADVCRPADNLVALKGLVAHLLPDTGFLEALGAEFSLELTHLGRLCNAMSAKITLRQLEESKDFFRARLRLEVVQDGHFVGYRH